MTKPEHDSKSSNSTNKDTDAASEESLAAKFAADKERFKMSEEEIEDLCRTVRQLFVIEGKLTQEECGEIERQIAAEKSQKEDAEKHGKEECQ